MAGLACVLRTRLGNPILVWTGYAKASSAFHGDVSACSKALQIAAFCARDRVLIGSDGLQLVQALKTGS